jgi:hypothetical protein
MSGPQTDLEMAMRDVVEAEARISEQKELIRRIEWDGHPTETATDLLRSMQETLEQMKVHLKYLRETTERQ